ncbi:MAG: glycosyltransferase [Phycisphaerae bacterium]|jgi:CMP-N-acetylneuraminic acid synthetase|nr:glycosyltransferase [Phycisphaerae bacterium]
MCKVTVYIPTYNYGQYLAQAVDSVLAQTLGDWELIVINDGSTDNTSEVLDAYRDNPQIRIIDQENKGLNVTNNIALRLARGEYITRLDGDDYMDENLLMILSSALDTKPEVALVYPDYYHVDSDGEVIEIVRREKIDDEVQLLDLPAHGACTMFRKDLLREIGGYIEDFSCQDGYELWLRFIRKHKPFNVNLPLFYYRRHGSNLTEDTARILDTRREIKARFVETYHKDRKPRVLGVILASAKAVCPEMHPMAKLNGRPLIWYTLDQAAQAESLDRVVLSTEDNQTLEYAKQFGTIEAIKRPDELTGVTVRTCDIVKSIIDELQGTRDYRPDAVAVLYANTPLRKACHIDKAVNTMMIFDVDSVISIQEELAPCYQHRQFGLTPVNDVTGSLRIERKALYKENGAVYLTKVEAIESGSLLGKTVGHITMLPEESIKINSSFDFWLAQRIMEQWPGQNQNP